MTAFALLALVSLALISITAFGIIAGFLFVLIALVSIIAFGFGAGLLFAVVLIVCTGLLAGLFSAIDKKHEGWYERWQEQNRRSQPLDDLYGRMKKRLDEAGFSKTVLPHFHLDGDHLLAEDILRKRYLRLRRYVEKGRHTDTNRLVQVTDALIVKAQAVTEKARRTAARRAAQKRFIRRIIFG